MGEGVDDEARMRVGAVVSGRLTASSRFRVLQHVAPLRALGVEVSVRPPRVSKYARVSRDKDRGPIAAAAARGSLTAAKLLSRAPDLARSWRNELTWLEREMLPGHRSLEPLLHRPMVFDVDDAIWLLSPGHERAVRAIARQAACVIAGNDFIAEWFSSTAPSVQRVWTAVDTERFHPGPTRPDGPFVVGWTGSGSTLRYLRRLGPPLGRFLAEAPDARLVVMADVAPDLPGVPPERLTFVPWSPEAEAAVVAGFDVGLMPLPDTDWARGKCAFKLLQYFACGIPAVASPVGMNSQVLAMGDVALPADGDDSWVEALLHLYGDRCRGHAMGRTGRAMVETQFAVPVIAAQLASAFRRSL